MSRVLIGCGYLYIMYCIEMITHRYTCRPSFTIATRYFAFDVKVLLIDFTSALSNVECTHLLLICCVRIRPKSASKRVYKSYLNWMKIIIINNLRKPRILILRIYVLF